MKKLLLGFILGILLCSGIVYAASYVASDISYTKEGTQTTVNDALNDLYKNATSSKIHYLGEGTIFDIKSLFPDKYNSLTEDNFIVGATSGPYTISGFYKYGNGEFKGAATGFTISKSYDSETGILTTNGCSQAVDILQNGEDGAPYWYGYQNFTCFAYLVIGELNK